MSFILIGVFKAFYLFFNKVTQAVPESISFCEELELADFYETVVF